MKKITLLVFAAMLTISAMADVKINVTNFPDAKFRSYLFSNSYGKDGVLTDEEIARITTIVVSDMGIQSMKGIEFLADKTVLRQKQAEDVGRVEEYGAGNAGVRRQPADDFGLVEEPEADLSVLQPEPN